MNVLITCAGRRTYLVDFFRQAVGRSGRVYVADMDPHAPAFQESDGGFVVPPIGHPEYCDELLAICRDSQVGMLIPLSDFELPLIARERERFRDVGTLAVVSAPAVVDMCFDKWATFRFLEAAGLNCPETYLHLGSAREALEQGAISFPLVVKPRWGTASLATEFPQDEEELEMAYRLIRNKIPRSIAAGASLADVERAVLIQQRLQGQEYGLDVVNDLEGRYVVTFVRRKLSMRAGETDRAMTIAESSLEQLGRNIAKKVGHIGSMDCDVFICGGSPYVLEMNPRFGGGYPFSHVAGANVPAMLVAWATGKPLRPAWLSVKINMVASKSDRIVVSAGPGAGSGAAIHNGGTSVRS